MSRFFAQSDTESETESSEDELIVQKPQSQVIVSDDEEVVRRVVRSTREKRYEELTELIKQIRNHRKIKDMAKILATFESLTQAFTKAKAVIDKEDGGKVPNFYIRILVEMEDFIAECWDDREGRKSMSKNNSKGLASFRQRIKKYNKDFETEIAAWRENPVDDEVEERVEVAAESDSDSDSSEDEKPSKTPQQLRKGRGGSAKIRGEDGEDDGEESDSSYWGNSDETTSSSDSDDDKYADNLAAKFLKKPLGGDKEDKEAREKKRERKGKKDDRIARAQDDDYEDGDDWQAVKGGIPMQVEKPKMFAKDAEINHASVLKKLHEIVAARGKKGTDRNEQIAMLSELLSIADQNNLGPAFQIKIMFAIISALFDYNLKTTPCMKPETWHKTLSYINSCLDDLFEHRESLVVGENISEESESLQEAPFRIKGCILTIVEKMDEEFTKILQNADAHSPEYIERLKDENNVCAIIDRLQDYLEMRGAPSDLCRVYLRKIDHLYYKFDARILTDEKDNAADLMGKLCKFIYAKDSTNRIRTQAILCHIYHSALHDRWYEARDLILMSHLQDSIQWADVATQILYNRALVQLGLCAFRHGNIRDAHNALLDIQSGGRAKEMLAQGLLPQRQQERTAEQEKIEKRRQMPFHKHINLELFECVYLVSAMLLEIPAIVSHELDGRKRMISKSFHYQLRNTERQPLVGPPESMREHVVAASKAMRVGNWRACRDFVINDKMNVKVWDLLHQADKVRSMIEQKIKEESLRTYLFMYSCVYDSLSLHALAKQFQLEFKSVHSIVSKMIIQEELAASVDEPNQMIVMHRSEPSRIQALALQLTDKVTQLIEHNEKLWDVKQGGYFNRSGGGQGGQGGGHQGGYRGDRGGQRGGDHHHNHRHGGDRDRRGGDRDGGYRRDQRGDHGGDRRGGGGWQNRQNNRRGGDNQRRGDRHHHHNDNGHHRNNYGRQDNQQTSY